MAFANALEQIEAAMRERGHRVEQRELPAETVNGTFLPPTIIEIDSTRRKAKSGVASAAHGARTTL